MIAHRTPSAWRSLVILQPGLFYARLTWTCFPVNARHTASDRMLLANKIPLGFIYRSIRADVLRVMAFSVSFHLIKNFAPEPLPIVPTALPTILGTAISLLLGFNVNQSYDRWWEARKIWGSIVNDSRTLVLQLQAFVVTGDGREAAQTVIERMAHRQIAWCYGLANALRGLPSLDDVDKSLISVRERTDVASHANAPLALVQRHAADLRALHQAKMINDFQQVQLDHTLVRLVASAGMAERIKKTVFPTTYRIFIHLFIYLFLIVLSLALVETLGTIEIPILVILAATFFMIETTARQLQDPFENKPYDTAMNSVSRNIEINLRQLVGEREVPKPYPAERFYIM